MHCAIGYWRFASSGRLLLGSSDHIGPEGRKFTVQQHVPVDSMTAWAAP